MPGREKDRTMRTVSQPLIRLGVRVASGIVPSLIRKTMDSTDTEEGLDVNLVGRIHSL